MSKETSITNLHMYMVTQNPIQGCRIDIRKQTVKSPMVIILDVHKMMQTGRKIILLFQRWHHR